MSGNQNKRKPMEEESIPNICEICGTLLVEEDGKMVCPHCDGDIDYFGEDDEDIS